MLQVFCVVFSPCQPILASGHYDKMIRLYDTSNNYKLLATVPTGPLGKTARLVPEISRYFVAVPQHGTTDASILVFEVQ